MKDTNQGLLDRVGMSPEQVRAALRGGATPRVKAPTAKENSHSLGEQSGKIMAALARTGASVEGWVVNALVRVTPAIAADWLERNHHNRKPSNAKIKRFAAHMVAGRWTLTGEPVKFDLAGELLDGQSRLFAIIEAKVPVVLEVRWGLPRAVQETMDTGETRSHAHQLEMSGEMSYPSETAAALRYVWLWENGWAFGSGKVQPDVRHKLTNTTIRETLERHPKMRESIARFGGSTAVRSLVPCSQAALLHYFFRMADAKKADRFWDGVATGANLAATSPIYLLRERLMSDKLSQAKIGKRERLALIIKAWNAFFAGEALRKLTFRALGEDPEIFPTIAGLKAPAPAKE